MSMTTLNIARVSAASQLYYPLILSLMLILSTTNASSLITYTLPLASSLAVSMGSSLTIYLSVTILAIWLKDIVWLSTFTPANTPLILLPVLIYIELASNVSRAISLGVRLFANLVAGHTLMNIVSQKGLISINYNQGVGGVITSILVFILVIALAVTILLPIFGLELGVAFIQAYVFTILTAIYIKEAIS